MNSRKIGIVGSGVMGQGIAQTFARNGYSVAIVDVNDEILKNAINSIRNGKYGLKNLVDKGKLSGDEMERIMSKITTSTDYSTLSDSAIAIEAVPEILSLKKTVFSNIEKNVSEDTIIASNTSGIMIAEMAENIKVKERIVGMHWFNPAPVMKLVEIVRSQMTSDETIQKISDITREIGKIPVIVADVPGFFTTRFITGWLLSATRSMENGVSSIKDIDQMVKLAFGFPMGPFELMDIIGLDTVYHISEYLYSETGDSQYVPPVTLKRMVLSNYTGDRAVKYNSRGGWYDFYGLK
ncbi:MAG: 3-hydroxyacyl-CoA dehydrogenase NAD-binding domain-containing protein [Thermoplasmata archaeon]